MSSPAPSRLTPHLLSALRIVAACLYVAHGTQKLFGYPGYALHLPPLPLTMSASAGYIEIVGGSLMVVGWFARPVAFVLAGEMAVAYFTHHLPRGHWPINNGGEPAILFCFVWLLVFAAGPGPWSMDAFRRGR